MIDLSRLKANINYVFPCRSYEDYLELIESAKPFEKRHRSSSAAQTAASWWGDEGSRGAIRITPDINGKLGYSYASWDFYESGKFGKYVTIVEISDYRTALSLDDWDDEPDLSLLFSGIGGVTL